MNTHIVVLLGLASLFSGSALSAPVNWSWNFLEPNIFASIDEDIDIYMTVKNDISSTESIELFQSGFALNDGTFGQFGIISDESGNPLYTGARLAPPSVYLNPGEELTFAGITLAAMWGLEVGDVVNVNPKFYINSGTYNKFADSSLTINLVSVPLPPSILLLISGVSMFLGAGFSRRNKKHATPLHG